MERFCEVKIRFRFEFCTFRKEFTRCEFIDLGGMGGIIEVCGRWGGFVCGFGWTWFFFGLFFIGIIGTFPMGSVLHQIGIMRFINSLRDEIINTFHHKY